MICKFQALAVLTSRSLFLVSIGTISPHLVSIWSLFLEFGPYFSNNYVRTKVCILIWMECSVQARLFLKNWAQKSRLSLFAQKCSAVSITIKLRNKQTEADLVHVFQFTKYKHPKSNQTLINCCMLPLFVPMYKKKLK